MRTRLCGSGCAAAAIRTELRGGGGGRGGRQGRKRWRGLCLLVAAVLSAATLFASSADAFAPVGVPAPARSGMWLRPATYSTYLGSACLQPESKGWVEIWGVGGCASRVRGVQHRHGQVPVLRCSEDNESQGETKNLQDKRARQEVQDNNSNNNIDNQDTMPILPEPASRLWGEWTDIEVKAATVMWVNRMVIGLGEIRKRQFHIVFKIYSQDI